MKRAFIASFYAWLTGTVIVFVFAYFIEAHGRQTKYSPVDMLTGLGAIAGIVAAVTFPLCLIVVAPLFRRFLRAFPKVKAPLAAPLGSATGLAGMYVVSVIYRALNKEYPTAFFVPDVKGEPFWVLSIIAAVVGAVFAFTYARLYRQKHPSPAAAA